MILGQASQGLSWAEIEARHASERHEGVKTKGIAHSIYNVEVRNAGNSDLESTMRSSEIFAEEETRIKVGCMIDFCISHISRRTRVGKPLGKQILEASITAGWNGPALEFSLRLNSGMTSVSFRLNRRLTVLLTQTSSQHHTQGFRQMPLIQWDSSS